jgi:hypothetical protein
MPHIYPFSFLDKLQVAFADRQFGGGEQTVTNKTILIISVFIGLFPGGGRISGGGIIPPGGQESLPSKWS